ncbi:hypothetical protein FOA43_003938 [Brettanomyces nanus]|uniref:Uncharacterized protein n=1 Tax=Eeniella nana TaxID=13502 RepID=A0A875SAD6_EENNA|nr:uncharacterized protein FOA43_003938 [Brettanomyces nanus]QPG76549.1 hypothetical protein FOA43_003938 [Brettanomyces nanus]
MNLKGLVDVAVWGGNDYVSVWDGKGWCDLMVRLEIGAYIGCYTCIFCILLNLLMIFMVNKATIWWFGHKKTRLGIEIFCSIVFPIIIIGISNVALSRRYSIYQISGCTMSFSKDRVAILVFFAWIFVWCILDFILSVGTLVLFFFKRKAAKDILVCTNSGMSMKRFLRLLIFCIFILAVLILTCINVGIRLQGLSSDFYAPDFHSKIFYNDILRYAHNSRVDLDKWIFIACSFIGFVAFGTGLDASKMYIDGIKKLPYGYKVVSKTEEWRNKYREKAKETFFAQHFGIYSDKTKDNLDTGISSVTYTPNEDYPNKEDSAVATQNYSPSTESPTNTAYEDNEKVERYINDAIDAEEIQFNFPADLERAKNALNPDAEQ